MLHERGMIVVRTWQAVIIVAHHSTLILCTTLTNISLFLITSHHLQNPNTVL